MHRLNEQTVKYIEHVVNNTKSKITFNNYPLYSSCIIANNYRDKIIVCDYSFGNCDADIVTEYSSEYDMCVIVINNQRTTQSLLKRLNFSLAHEIGHIELNHAQIFKLLDTAKKISNDDEYWSFYEGLSEDEFSMIKYYWNNEYLLEREADEFAGQLLVPLEELSKIVNKKYASDYFFVSPQVIDIRLEALNEIDCKRNKPLRSKEQIMKDYFNSVNEWNNTISGQST